MGRCDWSGTDGLLIRPCNAIHTLFVGMPIDVVFVGGEDVVLDLAPARVPWRVGPIAWRAVWVLELPVGTIERSQTRVDDHLVVGHVAE
jgi:uncharacterized protein